MRTHLTSTPRIALFNGTFCQRKSQSATELPLETVGLRIHFTKTLKADIETQAVGKNPRDARTRIITY